MDSVAGLGKIKKYLIESIDKA